MLNEQMSAWCDGELSEEAFDHASKGFPVTAEQRADCELAWLIGDSLRGDTTLSADFTSRVMDALASEPVVLAPTALLARKPRAIVNRWLPMAAAVAGVLVAGWMAVSVWSGGLSSAPSVALAPSPNTNVASAALAPDRAYLMAHQASSVGAPMADVAHFIRTVSDEQQGAAK